MFKTPKLKEHSFLVYGLGITGSSVINFFKRKKFQILKFMMINMKTFLKVIGQKILINH